MDIQSWLNSDSLIQGLKDIGKFQIKPPTFKKKIQSMSSEGQNQNMDIENLLFATNTANNGIGGTKNRYSTYDSQTMELYRKYNGESEWGVAQTRAIIDLRSAFISGEGVSVNSEDESFLNWARQFIKKNRVFGSRFFDTALGTELTGKALFTLKIKELGDYPFVLRIPYTYKHQYEVVLEDKFDPSSVIDIVVKINNVKKSLGLNNFVYIRTGGDDVDVNKTTTKTGLVLTNIENYDRAEKDLRRLNHILARITPTFETKDQKETDEVAGNITKSRWKIGKAYIGTAKFDYKVPNTGAHENLKTELSTSVKTISSTTGCPVHWIGWTDLMSNRATADSLYDLIDTATVRERTLIAEGIYDLIVKAQELYIDSGGTEIRTVNREFSVTIPIIDRSRFYETVRAMSLAYNDGVISKHDYQNNIIGIDPIKTNEYLKKEEEQRQKEFDNGIQKTVVPTEEEDEGDDNE